MLCILLYLEAQYKPQEDAMKERLSTNRLAEDGRKAPPPKPTLKDMLRIARELKQEFEEVYASQM
jgi:hypothetical protein